MNAPASTAVSVVVPFHNAERHFTTLLESLAGQRVSVPWEVILVDNRSTDGSRRIAEAFVTRLPARVVDATAMANAAYARNAGVRESSGGKLLFVDADDEVEEGYVAALATALDEHPLVTSRVDSAALNPQWVRDAHGPPWQAERIGAFYDFLPAAGINIGIRRELYERLGGIPEEFAASEDIAFSWNAWIAEQVPVHFVHEAVYRYRYRDSLRGLFAQSVSWGSASALLYRRFRGAGMPGRPLAAAAREWAAVLAGLSRASARETRAQLMVRLGYCVGRVGGSVRHRVTFL
jgi:glycosyltransferase involved in cell wall biosynthesis